MTFARAFASLSCAAAAALAACSEFPTAERPASVVESMVADFAFSVGALRAIEVPASGADLTVLHLHVEPAPVAERFERGHRILLLPAHCTAASVRCRLQRWARAGEPEFNAPPVRELFPGAVAVRFLDEGQQ